MNRNQLNELKSRVMNSWRYIERVFDGGIEDYEQFQVFTTLCENYLDLCNHWCRCVKPRFGWIQYEQMLMYRDLYSTCLFTVGEVNNLLSSWQSMYDAATEEAKQKAQLEERLRFEHAVSISLRDEQAEIDKKKSKTKPIGFRITPPKKKYRKKKSEYYD